MSSPWLTTAEARALLGYKSRQALYHLRRKGIFKAGVHFTQPAGMSTRWNRAALERHLAGRRAAVPPPPSTSRRRSKLAPHLMPGGVVMPDAELLCDKCHTAYSAVLRKPGKRCGDRSLDPEFRACTGTVRANQRHGTEHCHAPGCWSHGAARERTGF